MTVGLVRSLGTAQTTTAGTTITVTLANAVPAGDTVILRLVHEYTTGGPTAADTRSNTYTRDRTAGSASATIGSGFRGSTFRSYLTTALQVGDVITATLSASVGPKALAADQFTGLQNSVSDQNGFNGTGLGLGDATTIVGTSFTNNATNAVILNCLYSLEPGSSSAEINPSNSALTAVGTGAVTNNVTNRGGWKSVYQTGTQAFTCKLASSVKFQLHQFSYPLTAVPSETRDYTAVVEDLGAVAFYPLNEGHGQFVDTVRGDNVTTNGTAHGTVGRLAGTPVAAVDGGSVSFDGTAGNYVEFPDANLWSVATTGELTVALWLRPDTLDNTTTDGSDPEGHYVHWAGKGEDASPSNIYEYMFRLYNKHKVDGVTLNDRPNRSSAYHFNPSGGLGSGSYFQDTLVVGQWIFVAASFNNVGPSIYRDGSWRDGDFYSDYTITPTNTVAPFRLGTVVQTTWLNGAVGPVAVFPRRLTDDEIHHLYLSAANAAPEVTGATPLRLVDLVYGSVTLGPPSTTVYVYLDPGATTVPGSTVYPGVIDSYLVYEDMIADLPIALPTEDTTIYPGSGRFTVFYPGGGVRDVQLITPLTLVPV